MEGFQDESSNVQSRKVLANLFEHTSLRLSDVLMRLEFIDSIQREFIEKDIKIFSPWNRRAALLIKDFHIDIVSLMDSTAAVAIQGTIGLKHKDLKSLPGFADLLPNTSRSYRKDMGNDPVIKIVDSAEGWYEDVKKVRDLLTHRENLKIVYGLPSDGILFQVYEERHNPKILDATFLWPKGNNVVDFRLYSAFIVAESLLFLEDLATEVMARLNIAPEGLPKAYRIDDTGNFSHLLDSFDRLISDAP
jgi:hypothetical protein